MKDKTFKLITENCDYEYKVIKEAHDPTKPETLIVTGCYAQANRVNGNNRRYPYEVLAKAIEDFQKKIESNQALEELEHPEVTVIQPEKVCARTISLSEDNENWIGKSVVMASDPKFGIKGTPCGDLLKSLIQFDCAFGHSTRGVGNVNEDTGEVDEYQLICIDTVLAPSIGIFNKSNGNRFVNGILESKDFMIDVHGDIVEAPYHKFEKKLAKLPSTCIRSKKDQYVAEAIEAFLGELC